MNLSDEKFINAEDLNDSINNNNELINKKRERQNKKKIKVGLEFKLFYKLVDKYGIDKVLSSFSLLISLFLSKISIFFMSLNK